MNLYTNTAAHRFDDIKKGVFYGSTKWVAREVVRMRRSTEQHEEARSIYKQSIHNAIVKYKWCFVIALYAGLGIGAV